MVLYLKIISSPTLTSVESFMLVSGIAQSWLLAAQLLDLFNILRFYYFEITWFISMAILYIYLPNILKLVFSFSLTVCMQGKFSCFCCHLLTFFFKFSSSKNSFRNTIRVSNSLNPGCELVPNCLQRLSADNKSLLSRKEINAEKAENHGRNIIGIYQKKSFF